MQGRGRGGQGRINHPSLSLSPSPSLLPLPQLKGFSLMEYSSPFNKAFMDEEGRLSKYSFFLKKNVPLPLPRVQRAAKKQKKNFF